MNDQERNTILAGLRLWQHMRGGPSTREYADIATDNGAHPAMTVEEIDALSERINADASVPLIVVPVVRDGILEETYSNQPVTVLHIDYDIDGAKDSDLHTLPDGERVLPSLTAATVSDLADYQPLLAHLTEPAVPAQPSTPGE